MTFLDPLPHPDSIPNGSSITPSTSQGPYHPKTHNVIIPILQVHRQGLGRWSDLLKNTKITFKIFLPTSLLHSLRYIDVAVSLNNSKFDRGLWKNVHFLVGKESGRGHTRDYIQSGVWALTLWSQKCLMPAERGKEYGVGVTGRWVEGRELDLHNKATNQFLGLRSSEKRIIILTYLQCSKITFLLIRDYFCLPCSPLPSFIVLLFFFLTAHLWNPCNRPDLGHALSWMPEESEF